MALEPQRVDEAASRLIGHARKGDTDKGIAKDIRLVVESLTAAQGALILYRRDGT